MARRTHKGEPIEHSGELFGLTWEPLQTVAIALDLKAFQPITDCREVYARTSLTDVELGNETRAAALEIASDKLQDVSRILKKA
jgi:hypothetical protein